MKGGNAMHAANTLDDYPEKLKTKRQWAKLGYLPLPTATGTWYWTNQYYEHMSIYYTVDEVAKATQADLDAYWQTVKNETNKRRRELRAKKRREDEEERKWRENHPEYYS